MRMENNKVATWYTMQVLPGLDLYEFKMYLLIKYHSNEPREFWIMIVFKFSRVGVYLKELSPLTLVRFP